MVPSICQSLGFLVTMRSVENLSEIMPLLIFDMKERGSNNGFIFSFSEVDTVIFC